MQLLLLLTDAWLSLPSALSLWPCSLLEMSALWPLRHICLGALGWTQDPSSVVSEIQVPGLRKGFPEVGFETGT